MYSGGGQKLKWAKIYIEAPQADAEIIFQNRFGRNPNRVTCTCCGPDYSISESDSLAEASAFHRNCGYFYRDPKGKICPEDEAWVTGKGLKKGYSGGYEEMPSKEKWRTGKHIGLEEYLASDSAHAIYAKDIKRDERKGTLHEEGYVWRD